VKTCYVFHINTSYAEIPKLKLPIVSKKSYIPFLKLLQKHDLGTVFLNLTGLSIEYFHKEATEVLDLIKNLIDNDKIKILGCTYTHPILPLLPSDDTRMQIKIHQELVENHLETSPVGFFPPELSVDPILPKYLQEFGYEFMFVDGEALRYSQTHPNWHSPANNPPKRLTSHLMEVDHARGIRKVIRTIRAFREVQREEKRIDISTVKMDSISPTNGFPVVPCYTAITTGTQLAVSKRVPWVNTKRQLKLWNKIRTRHEKNPSIFVPYATDLEFIGYRDIAPGMSIKPEIFVDLMQKGIDNGFIPQIPEKSDWADAQTNYLKSSSWAPNQDFELWSRDPDNLKLELLCDEIRSKLMNFDDTEIKDKIWKKLLLAENSDGRGWDPIPERRKDCFKAAIDALELLA
jgi:predicted glycosyl hydrolase (DUF1957 family)